MEIFFLIILVMLALLAIFDLTAGVANDAVNFLNSAIGSKVTTRKVIMTVASIGLLVGVLTSTGMMEIARSGVFNPGMFTFSDIMFLLLAVMLTDVILLDVFNKLGLPTSTTVSLVFELLGSAVGVAIFCIAASPDLNFSDLYLYINTTKALAIVSGIFVSIGVAFVCGLVVMYITRLIFTFNFKSKIKSIGSIWCGIALTAITYFIVFKGLKGSPVMPKDMQQFISSNVELCVLLAFAFWTVVMFLLSTVKVNPLKITVLAGTFALALAFAGNDLVNFIGAFMAGFDSYNLAMESGNLGMTMEALSGPVSVNIWVLLIAGTIMAATLWFSKKANTVTATEVNLSRQEAGKERFDSTILSRSIVRLSLNINKQFKKVVPIPVQKFVNKRFELMPQVPTADAPAFDLMRASVNLTVSALLIALATSLKLPLSTTYVTFMVAMSTSLADRAWGRESAVYRITGVLIVISGWFLTVFMAFTASVLIAAILMWGKVIAVFVLATLCVIILFKNRYKKNKDNNYDSLKEDEDESQIVVRCVKEITDSTLSVTSIYNNTIKGIFNEDRKVLDQMLKSSKELHNKASERKYGILPTLNLLKSNYVETGHYYVQAVDYLNEVTKSLLQISKSTFKHIDNNHQGLTSEQIDDLSYIKQKMKELFDNANNMLLTNNFTSIESILTLSDNFFDDIANAIKNQIKRNKDNLNTTRSSILYLNILAETKIIILQMRNLLKAQKHFIEHNQ